MIITCPCEDGGQVTYRFRSAILTNTMDANLQGGGRHYVTLVKESEGYSIYDDGKVIFLTVFMVLLSLVEHYFYFHIVVFFRFTNYMGRALTPEECPHAVTIVYELDVKVSVSVFILFVL